MIEVLKKIARTLVTFFPSMKDEIYFVRRFFQNVLGLSVEEDFNAIDLFPKNGNLLYLDVGGNQGAIIDILLRKNQNCRVNSYEPNPEVFRLTSMRFKNNPRVKLFNFGLGKMEGNFKLYIPVYRGYKFDGLGSLSSSFDDPWLEEGIYFYDKKKLSMHEVDCKIKKLDDLDLDPFFIKIDIEGFELDVMLGGERTIEKSRPIMLVESVEKDSEIMNFVKKYGYKMYKYSNGVFIQGEKGIPNSFLMTDDKLEILQRNKNN